MGLYLERMTLGRVRGGPGRASAPAGRNVPAHFDQKRPKQLRIGRKIALGSGRRVRWEWNEVHHVATGPRRHRAPRDATSSPRIDNGDAKKGKFGCKTPWRAGLERMTLDRVHGGPRRASAPRGTQSSCPLWSGKANFDEKRQEHRRIAGKWLGGALGARGRGGGRVWGKKKVLRTGYTNRLYYLRVREGPVSCLPRRLPDVCPT